MVKVRTDFVTNSSSTSFIIIADGELKKEDFFDLVGVTEQSPLSPIFEMLFDRLLENMVPASEYHVREEFSEDVAHRVAKAQRRGAKVYTGRLSSDYNEIESFFCCDSFELENEKIYLNALECTW